MATSLAVFVLLDWSVLRREQPARAFARAKWAVYVGSCCTCLPFVLVKSPQLKVPIAPALVVSCGVGLLCAHYADALTASIDAARAYVHVGAGAEGADRESAGGSTPEEATTALGGGAADAAEAGALVERRRGGGGADDWSSDGSSSDGGGGGAPAGRPAGVRVGVDALESGPREGSSRPAIPTLDMRRSADGKLAAAPEGARSSFDDEFADAMASAPPRPDELGFDTPYERALQQGPSPHPRPAAPAPAPPGEGAA